MALADDRFSRCDGPEPACAPATVHILAKGCPDIDGAIASAVGRKPPRSRTPGPSHPRGTMLREATVMPRLSSGRGQSREAGVIAVDAVASASRIKPPSPGLFAELVASRLGTGSSTACARGNRNLAAGAWAGGVDPLRLCLRQVNGQNARADGLAGDRRVDHRFASVERGEGVRGDAELSHTSGAPASASTFPDSSPPPA